MKRTIATIVLGLTLGLCSNATSAEADPRLDAFQSRKNELIERFERARALADALKAMNIAEAEFRQVLEAEKALTEKLAAESKAKSEKEKKREAQK